jgi:hypothetical protein
MEAVEALDLTVIVPSVGIPPCSVTLPTVFSTPSSTMSASMGGGENGNTTETPIWVCGWNGNTMVTPIYCHLARDWWCGGTIRDWGSGRFCCRRVMDCSIESHKTQKVALKDDTLYLQGPHGGQAALLEPSLLIHQLPTEVLMEDLVGMEKPLKVMSALFE